MTPRLLPRLGQALSEVHPQERVTSLVCAHPPSLVMKGGGLQKMWTDHGHSGWDVLRWRLPVGQTRARAGERGLGPGGQEPAFPHSHQPAHRNPVHKLQCRATAAKTSGSHDLLLQKQTMKPHLLPSEILYVHVRGNLVVKLWILSSFSTTALRLPPFFYYTTDCTCDFNWVLGKKKP